MSIRSLSPLAAIPFLVGAAAAQGCAYERARTVPADVTFWGMQDCGGVRFVAPGVQFDTTSRGCPLLAVFTPRHEVAEPTSAATRTEVTGQDTVKLIFFRCERDYLLFFPLSSSCVFDSMQVGGPVPRMTTVGCTTGPQ